MDQIIFSEFLFERKNRVSGQEEEIGDVTSKKLFEQISYLNEN